MSALQFGAVDFVLTSPAQLKSPVHMCFSSLEWPVYFVPHYLREKERGKTGLFDERGRTLKIRNRLGFGFFEKMLPSRQLDICLGIAEWERTHSASSVLPLGSLASQHPGQATVPGLH